MKTYSGSYRTADGKAQIDWELTQGEHGYKFSACGEYCGGSGQMIDQIAKDYPSDPTVQKMAEVWSKYHLNDMKAGTPEQEAFLHEPSMRDQWERKRKGGLSYYEWAREALTLAGLFEVPIKPGEVQATGGLPTEVLAGERGYRYGERWLYSIIPQAIIDTIISWQNLPAKAPLHEDKAKEFLDRFGIKFRATLSDSKAANWEPAGHHYRITLSKGKQGQGVKFGQRVTFDFWGSQHDMKQGKTELTPYNVLAAISGDVHTPETFEEFCSEYGYEADSIKALQTFNRASRFAKRLQAFFTTEEIEALNEIR